MARVELNDIVAEEYLKEALDDLYKAKDALEKARRFTSGSIRATHLPEAVEAVDVVLVALRSDIRKNRLRRTRGRSEKSR